MDDTKENLPVVSYSKLNSYKTCPKQYKFAYIDKKPRIDKPATIFGSFCHEILENFHRFYLDKSNKNSSVIDVMQKCFLDSKNKWQPKISKDQLKEAYSIMVNYLDFVLKNDLPNVVDVEKKIWMPIDDEFILYGFIDRLQIDNDGLYHIIDYKTTKDPKYLTDRTQLLLYAYTLYKEFSSIEKIRTSFILLKHNMKSLEKENIINELIDCKDKLVKLWIEIKEDKLLRANPDFMKCKMCDFVNFCDEGKIMLYKNKVGKFEW